MDLVAIGQEVGIQLPSGQSLVTFAIVSVVLALIYVSSFGQKLRELLTETVFTNWRLALLGATGLVLSLASGWTTWDGMRNFTQEPVLSLMITFGIQGVMLIVAWLIGESFASGMNFRPVAKSGDRTSKQALMAMQPIVGTIIGLLLFAAMALLIINQAAPSQLAQQDWASNSWMLLPNSLLIGAIVILVAATLLLNAGSDIVGDYLQAIRVMVRSAVLWVMFLACMATSVFFSFDSLFSTIFPKEERVRAAELRAQNQVAGVVNDIGGLASRRRIEERDRLFVADGWKEYDKTLDRLVFEARQAPDAIRNFFENKMRERQKLVAQRQGEKASVEGQQVQLTQRTGTLTSQIGRAREVANQLRPVIEDLKSKIFAKDREIVAKKAEADAEAGGIGVTAKEGKGPKYREIARELRNLNAEKRNLGLQLREYQQRLDKSLTDVSNGERELANAQGELATLKSRASTAERLIELAKQSNQTVEPSFDPTNGLRQLEVARIKFRQNPTQPGLARIQALCATMLGAMSEVPTLKARAQSINCDPGTASEASERVFALNAGLAVLASNCIGGDKLPKTGGADGLFRFARQCVQDSGLPSRDTDELRTQINYLELNRDDKAHRFVVTSNAFQDGNKLAYLALAIAIAIDALVFMSGLFGANAVRSPLSDVPSHKGRSAQQLEAIIDTALQPQPFDNAKLVLDYLRPITPQGGFTGQIIIEDHDSNSAALRKVLNAASSISAVRHLDQNERAYQVRSELFEYLSLVAKRAYEKDEGIAQLAELERTVLDALAPHVGDNAKLVLSHMHPMLEQHGFMAEVKLQEISEPDDVLTVRGALNAGAIYERVQRAGEDQNHFYIHADFFKTLSSLRSRYMSAGSRIALEPGPVSLQVSHDQAQSGKGSVPAPLPTKTHSREATSQAIMSASEPKQIANDPPRPRNRDEFVKSFLMALEIEPTRLSDVQGEVFGAAAAASEAFKRFREDNHALSNQIDLEDGKARDLLEAVYANLKYNIPNGEVSEQRELDVAFEEIQSLRPVIMLLQGGPVERLMHSIVHDMEPDNAEGKLRPNEQSLFNVAKNLDNALKNTDRNTISAWSSLGGALDEMSGQQGNIRQLPNIATR